MIHLTRRQREICVMLMLGYDSKTMAKALVLSVRSIEDHRQDILDKFKMKRSADVVHYLMTELA